MHRLLNLLPERVSARTRHRSAGCLPTVKSSAPRWRIEAADICCRMGCNERPAVRPVLGSITRQPRARNEYVFPAVVPKWLANKSAVERLQLETGHVQESE